MKKIIKINCYTLKELKSSINKKNVIVGILLGLVISAKQAVCYLKFVNGHTVNIFESFMLCFSRQGYALIILIGSLLTCIDAPFINERSFFLVHRLGRHEWYKSSWRYIIFINLIYYLLIVLLCSLIFLNRGYYQDEWSQTILRVMRGYNSRMDIYEIFPPSINLTEFSPFVSFIFTFIDAYLYSVLLTSVVFVFNMLSLNKALGLITIGLFHTVSYLITIENAFLPVFLNKISMYRNAFFPIGYDKTVASPDFSIIFFVLLIYIIYIIGEKVVTRIDFYVR